MRNLKRMLCLVLSVVMLVGMMMIGAGAAGIDGFGDAAEIEHKDAVALLVELGVINGNNDGNFYPQGTLTREQMAKIAYLVMNVNQNYSIYEGTASALTDVAGRWSTGAIAWCNVNGIIAGGNDGTFSPEGTLTVAQTQTFLLRVLGYDNKLSGLTGTGWDINASILAQERGLMKGLDGLKSGDPITRDQACQMAFNALFITPVEVEKQFNFMTGEMVAVGYKTEDGEYTGKTKAEAVFELDEKTATISKVGADGKAYDADGKVIDGLTATPDMVGAPVTYYVRDDKVVSGATANNSSVIATIGAADWADSKKVGDKGEYIPAGKLDSLKYYKNDASGNFVPGSRTDIVAGSIIELVNTNADAKFEAVRVINKTVATVGNDGVTTKDGKVTVAGVVTDAKVETVKGYEDLEAGDVVLYYALTGVTYIEKADKTTGKVSSVTDKLVYSLGADKLSPSGLPGKDANKPAGFDFDNEYDFYLDNSGNIVKIALAGEAPAKEEVKYAVVLDFGYKGTASGEIDAEVNTTYQVKLLFPETNTQEIVTLKAIIADPDAATDEGKYEELTTDLNFKGTYQYQVVGYTVANNEYTLTATTAADDADKVESITGGKAAFEENFVANNKTIFLVGTGAKIDNDPSKNDYSKVKFTTYTGYANAPTIGGKGDDPGTIALKGIVNDENGIATLVYIVADKLDGAKSAALKAYVISKDYTETANGYEYSAVVDGEIVTLVAGSACFKAEGFYEYTTNSDGVIEDEPTLVGGILTGIQSAGNGIIKVNGEVYAYDEATKIYSIKNGKAELVEVEKLGAGKDNMSRVIIETAEDNAELIDYMYVLPATGAQKNTSDQLVEMGIKDAGKETVKINAGASFKTEGSKVTVTGTVEYSTGFDWFWPGNDEQTQGCFIALTLTAPNDQMDWELTNKAGTITKKGTLDAGDPQLTLILKLGATAANNQWTVEFSKGSGDSAEQTITYTIDATGAKLEAKPTTETTTPAA